MAPPTIQLGNNSVCLSGNDRIILSAVDTTPGVTADSIAIEFSFPCGAIRPEPIWEGFTQEATSQTNNSEPIVFQADFGSYLARPPGTARVIIPAGQTFTGSIHVARDPCNIPQEFWLTVLLDAGAMYVPPRWYHRLRVLAGNFTMNGLAISAGFDFSIQQGARYGCTTAAIIQIGVVI